MKRIAFLMILAAGCSSSSSGSSSGASTSGSTSSSGVHYCKRNTQTEECGCSTGKLDNLGSEWVSVDECAPLPSDAVACARGTGDGDLVDSCQVLVPRCGGVSRNFTTCDCSTRSDTRNEPVDACTGAICCVFDGACSCTTITGSSLDNTQFASDCTYLGKGTKVASCTAARAKPQCPSGHHEVTSCAGLHWAAPSGGGGGSSSSGECTGCHADSDCGHCGRCQLSTCTCGTKAVCN